MRLLCISNGHGEDSIALRILQALLPQVEPLDLSVLPIVGQGSAYQAHGFSLVGPAQTLPSGGFIYMDGEQLVRDVQAGLLSLTWAQLKAIRQWATGGGQVLAVGDIVPLLFAWQSGLPYSFVGTAKSEYWLRDEQGKLLSPNWLAAASVYWPWERWLMASSRCQAVFVRDRLTAEWLRQWQIKAIYAGNPMMDQLEPTEPSLSVPANTALSVVLLPGSRVPEAHHNWQLILAAAFHLVQTYPQKSIAFLAAIAPSLDRQPFEQILQQQGWQSTGSIAHRPRYQQSTATLQLVQDAFANCLHQADLAIAMAGTATEQVVGLGKPALTLPGQGPQFTRRFAEVQARLLGPSVILLERPEQVGLAVRSLLENPSHRQKIAQNGRHRMGEPGAAQKIAQQLAQNYRCSP
ncbi:MAG: lipid-A-disaccharide synthase-related protein [Almyronema sp.]